MEAICDGWIYAHNEFVRRFGEKKILLQPCIVHTSRGGLPGKLVIAFVHIRRTGGTMKSKPSM